MPNNEILSEGDPAAMDCSTFTGVRVLVDDGLAKSIHPVEAWGLSRYPTHWIFIVAFREA